MILILVRVIFVILLFSEIVMQNTWEVRNIYKMKNNSKWFYQKGCFKIFLNLYLEENKILNH